MTPRTVAGRTLSDRIVRLCDSADVWLDPESDRPYGEVTDELIAAIEAEATGTRSDDVRATIDELARGALVAYTKLRDEGWVMEPMPNEAEVRAALADLDAKVKEMP